MASELKDTGEKGEALLYLQSNMLLKADVNTAHCWISLSRAALGKGRMKKRTANFVFKSWRKICGSLQKQPSQSLKNATNLPSGMDTVTAAHLLF